MEDDLEQVMKRHALARTPLRVLLASWLMEAGFAWLIAERRPRAVGWWLTQIGREMLLHRMVRRPNTTH